MRILAVHADIIVTYNPEIHHRRTIRARGYDYSQPGSYVVTICTWEREFFLGEVVDGEMQVNEVGALVLNVWNGLPDRFAGVALDAFVVMPNHVHGIVILGAGPDGMAGEGGRAGQALPLQVCEVRTQPMANVPRW